MKCSQCLKCDFTSLNINYITLKCQISKKYWHAGEPSIQCPCCSLHDFVMTAMHYICIKCYRMTHALDSDFKAYIESKLKRSIWSKLYPIDLEAICIEAFKPSRVMYRMSIDDNYDEY